MAVRLSVLLPLVAVRKASIPRVLKTLISLPLLKFTGMFENRRKVVLDFARTCLKIWNRVDRGRFTIQDQKGNEIGQSVPKLYTYSGPKGQRNRPIGSKVIYDFVVPDLRGTLQKTTSFSKSSSHGAAHPSRACRNMRFSTKTFVANLLPYLWMAPNVQ